MEEKNRIEDAGWKLDNSYARLPRTFFTDLRPTPVRSPKIVVFNQELSDYLGLNSQVLQSEEGAALFAGNEIPEGAYPLAQAYAGHQFGYFTMLGDGRAILLGEQITPSGKRFDIQLKGSGRTPYSRMGDGRAALGPMLREYIISEAMHSLGIETTRSLAVVTTGETVIRDYEMPGAVLTRVASSHIRVGTFQYIAKWGTRKEVQDLADYTIQRHYPEVSKSDNPYLSLLKEVINRQAKLIAKWQLVGFIHGVMNTDNMTLSGETIDYGPCAFMDYYDPSTVFSSIDLRGRYAYGNQPGMAAWNLTRLAEVLIPLLSDNQEEAEQLAQNAIFEFSNSYHEQWMTGMRGKLGLFGQEPGDEDLVMELLDIMKLYQADYTNTFRSLTINKLEDKIFDTEEFHKWHERWLLRLSRQQEEKDKVAQLMKQSNPSIIPRNHRVEEALEAAEKGDYSVMEHLIRVLSNPYEYSLEQIEYTALPEPTSCRYRTFCGT